MAAGTAEAIDMSEDAQDFVPPYPKPLAEKPGWWRMWREGQRCPLRVFTDSAYRMKLGRIRLFRT